MSFLRQVENFKCNKYTSNVGLIQNFYEKIVATANSHVKRSVFLLMSSSRPKFNSSFQIASVLTRFSAQFCQNRNFMYAMSNIAYADYDDLLELIMAAKEFTLNVDKMLHILTNFDGPITNNTVQQKINQVERQFLSNLKLFPTSHQERVKRHCNFNIQLDFTLLNDIENIISIENWTDADQNLLDLVAKNDGRELPLLKIEHTLKVFILFLTKNIVTKLHYLGTC